jgi:hypothetical protein
MFPGNTSVQHGSSGMRGKESIRLFLRFAHSPHARKMIFLLLSPLFDVFSENGPFTMNPVPALSG